MSDTTIETFEHAGLTVRVGYEEDSSFANPRDSECNLGTMVCWHPRYVLGDEQLRSEEGRGAVETIFETERGRTDFRSMRQVERYLRFARGAVVTVPLYLYDHSGISISAGAPNPFDNPTVRRDELGRGLGWDSSMVGFIYTSAERIRELCGEPIREGDRFYCPSDYQGSAGEWIAEQLAEEVEVYDQYLRGEVYWYSVEDAAGEVLDGCGGFLGGGVAADGSKLSSFGYVKQEARRAAECEAARIAREAAEEARESAFWAARGVATIGGAS